MSVMVFCILWAVLFSFGASSDRKMRLIIYIYWCNVALTIQKSF